MRNLLTILLSLLLAALAGLSVWRFLSTERPSPRSDSRAPGNAVQAIDSLAADAAGGAVEASRALLGAEASPPPGDFAGDGTPQAEDSDAAAAELRAATLARVEDRFRRQTEHIGNALNLSATDREHLFAVLLGEYERRTDFFEEMRQDAFDPEMRARVRDELLGIQQWKIRELQAKLGAELAQAVNDLERGGEQRSFERDGKERTEN